jgi:hypothetical protein
MQIVSSANAFPKRFAQHNEAVNALNPTETIQILTNASRFLTAHSS